jgi:hypothetical protein
MNEEKVRDSTAQIQGERRYTMITTTFWEFALWSTLMILLGATGWDIIWTALISDARAASHFGRAATKHRLAWIAVLFLIIVAIIGWLY